MVDFYKFRRHPFQNRVYENRDTKSVMLTGDTTKKLNHGKQTSTLDHSAVVQFIILFLKLIKETYSICAKEIDSRGNGCFNGKDKMLLIYL